MAYALHASEVGYINHEEINVPKETVRQRAERERAGLKPMTDREALRLREQRVIANAKLRLDLAVCRSELASKIGPTIFASENRPEDRSGLGAKYGFVEKHFKPFPTIHPEPVVIEAHGLRIKVEKL